MLKKEITVEFYTIEKAALLMYRGAAFIVVGVYNFFLEEDKGHNNEEGEKDGARPTHVTKEARHFYSGSFSNGANHEVWCVTNIGSRPHENSPGRNSYKG